MPHPMQPVEWVNDVIRFRQNKIVRDLLDFASARGMDLNTIARDTTYNDEDRAQLAQLIGYSVSGFGELNYASSETVAAADAMAERLSAAREQGK